MELELYPWQGKDKDQLQTLFKTYRRVLYQLATGAGKTVIAGSICQGLRRYGTETLILVHRKELVNQFVSTLTKAGLDDDIGVVQPSYPATPWAPIQIASVFSLVRRKLAIKPKLIIVDEAHHIRAKTWEKCLAQFPDAWVLGLTATPKRLDGKGLKSHFDYLHCGPTIDELIEGKYLSPVTSLRLPVGFNLRNIRTIGGDYDRHALAEQGENPLLIAAGVHVYQKHLMGRKAIYFGASISNSFKTAEKFRAAGIRAEHIDGNSSDNDRDRALNMFGEGALDVLCNYDLISEGFDCPSCDAIMDAHATKSTVAYLQRIGRAMRYQPGKVALHADLCNNIVHGLYNEDRDWSLRDDEVQEEEKKSAPISNLRCCHACATVYPKRHRECPTCGVMHENRPVLALDVTLQEVLPQPKKKRRMNKADLEQSLRGLRTSSQPMSDLRALSEKMKYDERWVQQVAKLMRIAGD